MAERADQQIARFNAAVGSGDWTANASRDEIDFVWSRGGTGLLTLDCKADGRIARMVMEFRRAQAASASTAG